MKVIQKVPVQVADRLIEEIDPLLWIPHESIVWIANIRLKQQIIHYLCKRSN